MGIADLEFRISSTAALEIRPPRRKIRNPKLQVL
jgi:hypothetical protein